MKKFLFLIAIFAFIFASCGQFEEQSTPTTSVTITAAQFLPRAVEGESYTSESYTITVTMKYVDDSADPVEQKINNATTLQSITFEKIEIGKTVQFECKVVSSNGAEWNGTSEEVLVSGEKQTADISLTQTKEPEPEPDEYGDKYEAGIFNYPAFVKTLAGMNKTLDDVETFEIPDSYHTINIGNRGWIFFEDPNKKDDANTKGARKLTELIIPKSIKNVGKDAFKMYYVITETPVIKYKGTLNDWFQIEFLDMEDSQPMTWGQKLEMLAEENATETESISGDVTIPNTAKIIPTGTFKNSGITSVKFEPTSDLEEIGRWAFQNVKSLTGEKKITIPASVTKIYPNAFNGAEFESIEFEKTDGWKLYVAEGDINYEKPAETGTDIDVSNSATNNATNLQTSTKEWCNGFLIRE